MWLSRKKPDAEPLLLNKGGEIKFENVTFGYRPDRPILQGLNLTIPAGKKVAIVGPSGCGKSTILRLLCGFYDVQDGRITIDGQDIRDVQIESLRKSIGVVPQDTPLFNDTIEHNIRYGDINATTEAVQTAAQRAKIHGTIQSLPDGYQTMVGERGMMISGGEKTATRNQPTGVEGPALTVLRRSNERVGHAYRADTSPQYQQRE